MLKLKKYHCIRNTIKWKINGIQNVFEEGTLDIKDKYSVDFISLQSQTEWDNFLIRFPNKVTTMIYLTC
jgi:hypothetical protein